MKNDPDAAIKSTGLEANADACHELPCRHPGYYWVEFGGETEIMQYVSSPDRSSSAWRRIGSSEAVAESSLDHIYPVRLTPPTLRMDNLEDEEEFAEDEFQERPVADEELLACFDCGLSYPFDGLDLFLPEEDWQLIAPLPNGRGILCPDCIARRVSNLDPPTVLRGRLERLRPVKVTWMHSLRSGPDDEL